MGLNLKTLFKKKPGGTFVGNLIRGGVAAASSLLPAPAANLVSALLPAAPPLVMETASQAVAQAINTPVLTIPEIKFQAKQVQASMLAAGASPDEASKIGSISWAAMTAPPDKAAEALAVVNTQVNQAPANSFVTKDELKKLVDGAVQGAVDGATDTYLNKTEIGKAQKKGAINSEGAKIMPWVIGGCFAVIAWLLGTRNK